MPFLRPKGYTPLKGFKRPDIFEKNLETALEKARRGELYTLILIDVNGLKRINDTYGHLAGDQYIMEIAARIKRSVPPASKIGRLGGDELVVLAKIEEPSDAFSNIVEKIIREMRRPMTYEDREWALSVSIGSVLIPIDGEDAKTLIENVDSAMYTAKRLGRDNSYQPYTPDLKTQLSRETILKNSINAGIFERNEIIPFYQQQISVQTGRPVAIEVLTRWHHPKLGAVLPTEFLPLMEQRGFISEFNLWVIREACIQNMKWIDKGISSYPIAVNIGIEELLDKKFPGKIMSILEETGLPAGMLELEISENSTIPGHRHVSGKIFKAYEIDKMLEEIKEMGVKIALDDFGSGQQDRARLTLPIDKVKFGKNWIDDIYNNDYNYEMAQALAIQVALVNSLGKEAVVEGVETQDVLKEVSRFGCHAIQGYYMDGGQPMPAEVAEIMLHMATNKSRDYKALREKPSKYIREKITPATRERVLVVEDNPDVRDVLVTWFQMNGLEVKSAESGEKAAEIFACFQPDAVVLDINLPRINGYDIAEKMKEHLEKFHPEKVSETIFIALSGKQIDEKKKNVFDYAFKKPMLPEDIAKIIRNHLALQKNTV